MIQKAPGVEDIFPDKIDKWNFVQKTAREIFAKYNFKEIILPIMEYTQVFSRGLGDETDIVSKEMFTFEDRGGRSLTLRPEGTASTVRAFVENGEFNRLSLNKFFYSGPMFRAEKPQRGRLRQFNQIGSELFGSSDPYYDFEVIAMINDFTLSVGIENYEILLNSIGCTNCRKEYIIKLKEYYESKQDLLCQDCRKRLTGNTLRLLDCKQKPCIELKNNAPLIKDFLDDECKEHFAKVKQYLQVSNISFTEEPHLVRGLDYYNKTTFEFVSDDLGGQNTFAAGGRYDSLVEHFGGGPTPAIGFAAGVERILLLIENKNIASKGIDAYIIHSCEEAFNEAMSVLSLLRVNGFSADFDPSSKSFKSQFKKADREKAHYAVVIGEDELKSGLLTVKDLSSGEQKAVGKGDLVEFLGNGRP